MTSTLTAKAFKLLNLSAEWLRTYLPHCLAKIDRVSFGLLSMAEYARLLKSEPHMPRSRFKLAIPFVGKDVPSRAADFEKEVGPFPLRKSSQLYAAWVAAAGGIIKGS